MVEFKYTIQTCFQCVSHSKKEDGIKMKISIAKPAVTTVWLLLLPQHCQLGAIYRHQPISIHAHRSTTLLRSSCAPEEVSLRFQAYFFFQRPVCSAALITNQQEFGRRCLPARALAALVYKLEGSVAVFSKSSKIFLTLQDSLHHLLIFTSFPPFPK